MKKLVTYSMTVSVHAPNELMSKYSASLIKKYYSSSSGGGSGGSGGDKKRSLLKMLDVTKVDLGVIAKPYGVANAEYGINCPILMPQTLRAMDDERKRFNIISTGDKIKLVGSSATAHEYYYVHCIGNLKDLAKSSKYPEERLRHLISSPIFYTLLWAGCLPFGGAVVELAPQPLIRTVLDTVPRPLLLKDQDVILTDGKDPIRLSHHATIYDIEAFLTSFLARTLYGHGLTGSVLHNLLCSPDGSLHAFYVGAGRGLVGVAGSFNNYAALHDEYGIWSNQVRNFIRFLSMAGELDMFLAAIEELIEGRGDVKGIAKKLTTLAKQTTGRDRGYMIGEFMNVYLGKPPRVGSKIWGGEQIKGQWPEEDTHSHRNSRLT